MIKNIVGKVRASRLDTTNIEHLYAVQTLGAIAPKKGILIECGVYKGGSAAALINLGRGLIICDTFEGLPELGNEDMNNTVNLTKGRFLCSKKDLKKNFKELGLSLNGVEMVKGRVELTVEKLSNRLKRENKRIAFLHLDIDLYAGTKICLKYFKPLMADRGIIAVHDYGKIEGINLAVDEMLGTDNLIWISQHSICWINREE